MARRFVSRRQHRWAFASGADFAERWAVRGRYRRLPEKKALPPGVSTGGGKLTRSEVARLGALARAGKYKGKGRQAAGGSTAAAERETQRRQQAQQNRADVMAQMGVSAEDVSALEALASGTQPGDTAALERAGLVERGKDGTARMTPQGKAAYNAASRGDAGAAGDALSRAKDRVMPAEKPAAAEKPKGGGGGGGGGKEKPDKAAERAKVAAETAQRMGLPDGAVDTLRKAQDEGVADSEELRALGLIDDNGDATDQGRRALTALELGKPGNYRAAVQDARNRMQREGAARERQAARDDANAVREQERASRARARGESKHMWVFESDDDPAIKQTASERAMFANMGSSGGGGGGGGSGKPTGGTGGLWKRNPETGKREPAQGLEKGAPPPKPGTARAEAQKPRDDAASTAARDRATREAARISDNDADRIVRLNREAARAEFNNRHEISQNLDGSYSLRDTSRRDSAGIRKEVATGSREQVERAAASRERAAMTRAETEARSRIANHNSDVMDSRLYPDAAAAGGDGRARITREAEERFAAASNARLAGATVNETPAYAAARQRAEAAASTARAQSRRDEGFTEYQYRAANMSDRQIAEETTLARRSLRDIRKDKDATPDDVQYAEGRLRALTDAARERSPQPRRETGYTDSRAALTRRNELANTISQSRGGSDVNLATGETYSGAPLPPTLRRLVRQYQEADAAAFDLRLAGKTTNAFEDDDLDFLKASRRHSAADEGYMKAGMAHLREARKAFSMAGAPDEDGDGMPDSVKALDYGTIAEMVEDAVIEAAEGDDDAWVKVYADTAIFCEDGQAWRLGWRMEGGVIILDDADTWEMVEAQWKPVPGAEPGYEPEDDDDAPVVMPMGYKALPPAEVEDEDFAPVAAIKAIGDYALTVRGIVYGGRDLQGDTFGADTDLGFGRDPIGTPVFYDHAQRGIKSQIGHVIAWKADDDGIDFEVELDRRHKYAEMVMGLARKGALGGSTGALSHLVVRERGALKRWIVGELSLTPTPAEPRSHMKATTGDDPVDMGGDATPEASTEAVKTADAGGALAMLALDTLGNAIAHRLARRYTRTA